MSLAIQLVRGIAGSMSVNAGAALAMRLLFLRSCTMPWQDTWKPTPSATTGTSRLMTLKASFKISLESVAITLSFGTKTTPFKLVNDKNRMGVWSVPGDWGRRIAVLWRSAS